MLHIVHLLERRFPNGSARTVATLVLLSAGALLIGAVSLLR